MQWALVSALDEVQQSFACEGRLAGSTATIVLQARLLIMTSDLLFCAYDCTVKKWMMLAEDWGIWGK